MVIDQMQMNDFIKKPYPCSCGHPHTIDLKAAVIEEGAIRRLPAMMADLHYRKAFLVADRNTYAAAGERVAAVLDSAHVSYRLYVLESEDLIPDERAVGSVVMAYDSSFDLIIAIGTGTINDIVKFASHRMGLPYFIVGTAPSMDGFVSTAAAMTNGNMKITYEAHVPQAFIGDLDVLAHSPMPMIAAGFGDMLGKYTSLQDWKLSHIVTGEYFCPTVAEIMSSALRKTIESSKELLNRDKQAIAKLTEGLLLSGIAMSYVNNSRPASGSEHHMSHFWEMKFQYEGRKPVLHGTKVGIGTLIALRLYENLKEVDFSGIDYTKCELSLSYDAWRKEISRVYPLAAESVIALEKSTGKNTKENRNLRIDSVRQHYREIEEIIHGSPSPLEMEQLLAYLNGPILPAQVDIDPGSVRDSILYAKELRNRYTVLQLLWDLGLLNGYADRIIGASNPHPGRRSE